MTVEHDHILIDADPHFSINVTTRAITNETSKKVSLMQYDNNSERFSFDIDRYVEGHDMLNCDRVQVHYYNTSSGTRAKINGLYRVTDLAIKEEDDNKLTFSWLISDQVTQQAGVLYFLISFECTNDGDIIYRWNTGVNSSITIVAGINNDGIIVEDYPDVLAYFEDEINDYMTETTNIVSEYQTSTTRIIDDHKQSIDQSMLEYKTETTNNVIQYQTETTNIVNDHTTRCEARIDEYLSLNQETLDNNYAQHQQQISTELDACKEELKLYVQERVDNPTEFATSSEVSAIFYETT